MTQVLDKEQIMEQQLQEDALLAFKEKNQELARIERDHKYELRMRGFILKTSVITASVVVCAIVVFSLSSLLIWGNETKWQTVYNSLLEMLSYIWTALGAGAVGLIFGRKFKK